MRTEVRTTAKGDPCEETPLHHLEHHKQAFGIYTRLRDHQSENLEARNRRTLKAISSGAERGRRPPDRPNGQGKPSPYAKAARPYPSNPPYASKYELGDERPASNHDNASYPGQDANSMHPPPSIGGRSSSVHSQYSNQSSQPPLLLPFLGKTPTLCTSRPTVVTATSKAGPPGQRSQGEAGSGEARARPSKS